MPTPMTIEMGDEMTENKPRFICKVSLGGQFLQYGDDFFVVSQEQGVCKIVDGKLEPLGWVKPQWQPIKTAPKDETPILSWIPDMECISVVKWYDAYWTMCDDFEHYHGANVKPTHWMPLPKPPGETK